MISCNIHSFTRVLHALLVVIVVQATTQQTTMHIHVTSLQIDQSTHTHTIQQQFLLLHTFSTANALDVLFTRVVGIIVGILFFLISLHLFALLICLLQLVLKVLRMDWWCIWVGDVQNTRRTLVSAGNLHLPCLGRAQLGVLRLRSLVHSRPWIQSLFSVLFSE